MKVGLIGLNLEFLEKIYKIGIFNALILKDRKISKICEYINGPRNKKDAKKYYQINVDDTEVVADTEEDSIAKTELKNILNYYAKLGNDTSKYSETFERIAEQYSDVELVYIIARFPENVKSVLMNENQRFRNLMNIDPKKLQQMELAKKQQEALEKQYKDKNMKLRLDAVEPTYKEGFGGFLEQYKEALVKDQSFRLAK